MIGLIAAERNPVKKISVPGHGRYTSSAEVFEHSPEEIRSAFSRPISHLEAREIARLSGQEYGARIGKEYGRIQAALPKGIDFGPALTGHARTHREALAEIRARAGLMPLAQFETMEHLAGMKPGERMKATPAQISAVKKWLTADLKRAAPRATAPEVAKVAAAVAPAVMKAIKSAPAKTSGIDKEHLRKDIATFRKVRGMMGELIRRDLKTNPLTRKEAGHIARNIRADILEARRTRGHEVCRWYRGKATGAPAKNPYTLGLSFRPKMFVPKMGNVRQGPRMGAARPRFLQKTAPARIMQRARIFRKNPVTRNAPTLIYGKTDSITMQKTNGPYKGQRFVHDFKTKPCQYGIPRGTVLTFPGGKKFHVTTRSVLLSGKKDIWQRFPA